uniref:Uncharacterized protein n=1 Tax=viral metagenome TaxID=1070528 RepID=A0A6M3MHQ2_9ZZZZ
MKLASYHGTRSGLMALGSMLIRLRLRGPFSHTEAVFEPGDGVDHLMPDGTCQPDADGALWCCSSVGLERIPAWSRRRPGRLGGVRMKRIVLNPKKWTLDPVTTNPIAAAQWARDNEGRLYDWQLILGFVSWLIPRKKSRVMCTGAALEMLGVPHAWRFDPCSAQALVSWRKP